MKKLLGLFLALFCINSFAAEINCYSKKNRIYHGYGHDFSFNEDFMSFIEEKTNHLIIASAECLIIVRINQGEKFNAIDLRQKSQNA